MLEESYKKQLSEMHQAGHFSNGKMAYGIVEKLLKKHKFESLLDFGCGKGDLIKLIEISYPNAKIAGYDPGYEEYNEFPMGKFDLVISTDALEHVEPAYLDKTLQELGERIDKYALIRIACYPAVKKLPDGRNAHLIVQSPGWWRNKILNNINCNIVCEKIKSIDKTDRWDWVKGEIYDVKLVSKDHSESINRKIELTAKRVLNKFTGCRLTFGEF